MPRRRPPDRLRDLADAAVTVFTTRGYRRTQVSDVAETLGVAKGTVYLYVESKEALFDLALRSATGRLHEIEAGPLPLPSPAPSETLDLVREEIRDRAELPKLAAALARRRVDDVRSEFEGILEELFDLLDGNRAAIKLVDRCAHDYPDLADVWFADGRVGTLELLQQYLTAPARRRHVRPMVDPAVTARLVTETITFWAVHSHWDPSPQDVDPSVARASAISFVLDAIVKEAS